MAELVLQMTKDEFREILESSIEQKLLELLGDPDEGLFVRDTVRKRLLHQRAKVTAGERGEPFEDIVKRLKLD